jgi:hypothetical protein
MLVKCWLNVGDWLINGWLNVVECLPEAVKRWLNVGTCCLTISLSHVF